MFSYRAITDEDTHLRGKVVWKLYIYSATAKTVLAMDETWFSTRLPTRLRAYFQLEWERDRTRQSLWLSMRMLSIPSYVVDRVVRPGYINKWKCFCFSFLFYNELAEASSRRRSSVENGAIPLSVCGLWVIRGGGGGWVMLLFGLLAAWYYRERSNQLLLRLLLYGM